MKGKGKRKGEKQRRREGKGGKRKEGRKKGGDEGWKNSTLVLRKNWKEKVTTMRQTACPFFQSLLT